MYTNYGNMDHMRDLNNSNDNISKTYHNIRSIFQTNVGIIKNVKDIFFNSKSLERILQIPP